MQQWTVDAFASEPFRGNPACVVEPFDLWPTDAWMQAMAQENNQAETAFLLRTADEARFGLRWFTPLLEVPLCGHATLASAHVLFTEFDLPGQTIQFDTQSGPLTVSKLAEGYAMDFPAHPPERIPAPEGLSEALGVRPEEVWTAQYLVAVLKDAATVRGLRPDISAIEKIAGQTPGGRGNLIVCARDETGEYDVIDRFFAPGSGIAEDPATGSAHCILTPLYAQKLNRPDIRFHQAYPGRGGDITGEFRGDRVILKGAAVTILESRLRL